MEGSCRNVKRNLCWWLWLDSAMVFNSHETMRSSHLELQSITQTPFCLFVPWSLCDVIKILITLSFTVMKWHSCVWSITYTEEHLYKNNHMSLLLNPQQQLWIVLSVVIQAQKTHPPSSSYIPPTRMSSLFLRDFSNSNCYSTFIRSISNMMLSGPVQTLH